LQWVRQRFELKWVGRMSDMELSIGLFPGQGGYRVGCLNGLLADPDARRVLTTVDEIITETLGKPLLRTLEDNASRNDEELFDAEPELVQVASFAVSVALFEVFRARGATPSVLIGHSLGEIGALVCSGAMTLDEGTRILSHRITVLRENDTSGGRMLALACDRERAEQILALLPTSDAVVAVANGPSQTGVSGSADALSRVARIAEAIGVPATRLRAQHPFHNPLLAAAGRVFAERVRGHRSHGFRTPVFSPILGRYYREQDDLGELLAAHLVAPVEFGAAVDRAHDAGARIWVEFGAGRVLTNLVRARHREVTVLTPLHGSSDALIGAVTFLGGRSDGLAEVAPTPVPVAPVQPAAPVALVAPVVAVEPKPAVEPAAPPAAASSALSRDDIEAKVRKLYSDALEYPEEVFEHDAELEADLGIDSVKQTELMGRLGDLFELGPRPEGMRMGDYRTFGKVIEFVSGSLPSVNGSHR
jgi:acyl transferase domain-containing protein/acyl carrier protein